jgi:hypothetical protein
MLLVGNAERKTPLEGRRPVWVDNIKMDLEERGWGGMDWIDIAQYRDSWRAVVKEAANLLTNSVALVRSVKCWKVVEWLHNWLHRVSWVHLMLLTGHLLFNSD